MAIDAKVRAGMSREAAAYGRPASNWGARPRSRTTCAMSDGSPSIETTWQDVGYAARTLRRAPVFTVVTVVSLALGIGANTAIFTLLNTLMLRSLPVSHPEELLSRYPGEPRMSSFSWRTTYTFATITGRSRTCWRCRAPGFRWRPPDWSRRRLTASCTSPATSSPGWPLPLDQPALRSA